MAVPPGLTAPPKAPQLGAFPLDHFRECRTNIEAYYRCLQQNEYIAPRCREEVKAYLECRMEKGLMNKADIEAFGVPSSEFVLTRQHKEDMRSQMKRRKLLEVGVSNLGDLRSDLELDDGFERDRVTGQPLEGVSQRPKLPEGYDTSFFKK